MKIDLLGLALLSGLLVVSSGCAFAPARKVMVRPGKGGIVAIPGPDWNRGRAEEIMREVCQSKKYEIVEEIETPVSTFVDRTSEKYKSNSSNIEPTTYNSSLKHSSEEVSRKVEWRIAFKCSET